MENLDNFEAFCFELGALIVIIIIHFSAKEALETAVEAQTLINYFLQMYFRTSSSLWKT